MIPADWISHQRPDGEVIGYVELVGDLFRPYDLLGRPVAEPGSWMEAEELLDEHGLSWLADPYLADLPAPDGGAPGVGAPVERRVRITEVDRDRVGLVADEFGAAQAVPHSALDSWTLPLPLTILLRPLR